MLLIHLFATHGQLSLPFFLSSGRVSQALSVSLRVKHVSAADAVLRKTVCSSGVAGQKQPVVTLFPAERKYQSERRKFGLKSSVMLHLLSRFVPKHSESHSQSQHTGTRCSYAWAHTSLCTGNTPEYGSERCETPLNLDRYALFCSVLQRVHGMALGTCFMCAKAELSSLRVSWVFEFDTTESPASFICLFGVCCHKPNLHVDINSLRSLTELMNADYASRRSDTCRSARTCTYACIWTRTHGCKHTHTRPARREHKWICMSCRRGREQRWTVVLFYILSPPVNME